MGTSDNFCLRWNDFETNISTSFRELRRDSEFFDVTLCCDNGSDRVPAHKVILAACSPLFRRILHGVNASSSPNPLLYLKGIQKKELTAILNFMYHGEVNVAQDSLNAFLAVAEELAVKGLTTDSKPEGFAGSAHATSSAGGGAAASAAVDDPSDPDYSATGSSKKRPVKKTPASAAKLARKRPDDDDDDGGDVKRVKAEPDVMIPDDDEGVAGGSGVGGAGAGPDFGDDEFGGGGGEGFDDSYGGYDDLEDNGGLDTTGGAGGGGEVTKETFEIERSAAAVASGGKKRERLNIEANFVRSKYGSAKLVDPMGYQYMSSRRKEHRIYWNCLSTKKSGCRVRAVTEGFYIIKMSNEAHNHLVPEERDQWMYPSGRPSRAKGALKRQQQEQDPEHS